MILETGPLKPLIKFISQVKSEYVVYSPALGFLTAADSNLAVRVEDSCLVHDVPEIYLLPLGKFSSFVGKAGKHITLTQSANTNKLVSGRLSVEFPVLAVTPKPTQKFDYTFSIPTNVLKDLVGYASAVTNPKETMTYSGVLEIKADEDLFEENISNSIKIVSTDGHRCASIYSATSGTPFKFLLPTTLVPLIANFTGEKTEVSNNQNTLGLKCGGVEVVSPKFSVQFPDVYSVFPDKFSAEAKIDQAGFLSAMNNIQPFLDSESPDVTLTFDQTLTITTGSAKDEVEYVDGSSSILGKKFKTSHRFIADFLPKVTGMISIKMSPDGSRVVLESGSRKYLFVTKA